MARQYLIANWKMNLPPEGREKYIDAMAAASRGTTTIVVAPPFTYLSDVVRLAGGRLAIAGQNCADHESGAFTGEISPAMLRDCGAQYVIIGHSERRSLYGETDAVVARKLALAYTRGLVPVLCIGEDLRTRDSGHVARFIADQVRAVSQVDLEKAEEVIIAYEPIWAIGTGRNASGLMVAETIATIRDALKRFWPDQLHSSSILYGGSVTPENVADLVAHGNIDGFLVGGASLDSSRFMAILAPLTRP